MYEYDFASFVDEYVAISKEAALMDLAKGGIRAMKGGVSAAKKGWQGSGVLAEGKQGLSGMGTAMKNYVSRMAGSQRGSRNLMAGGAMLAVPTAATAGYLASR
ncbi:MAG: hypothetical protein KDB07_05685 [Planctomycetes bacterium]|nr:hypothetical protein [Planctomycetota bacterium]